MLHQRLISKEIQSSRELNISMMYSLPHLFYLKAIKNAETNVEGCNARAHAYSDSVRVHERCNYDVSIRVQKTPKI